MPPKTERRTAGTRSVDGGPARQLFQTQLEERLVHLLEELDKERQEKSFFQLERNKIQACWEISKRNLEEAESELRRRSREREEAEECRRVEIGVYKQKLKLFFSEQQSAVSSSSPVQNHHMEPELVPDVGGRRGAGREELQLKQQVELMELSNDYERRLRDLEVSFHQKLQSVMEAEQRRQRAAVREVERQLRSREASLVVNHDKALRKAEEHHLSTETRLQDQLKMLKEQLQEQQEQHKRVNGEFSAAQQENRRLTEGLHEEQLKLTELQRRMEEQQQDKDSMKRRCARLKVVEKELRELKLEHELLLEAFQKVQWERDELLRTQTQMILDVQQRSDLKKMMLERKLAALTDTLELKEVQLCGARPASDVHLSARSHPDVELQEVLESRPVSAGGSGSGTEDEQSQSSEKVHATAAQM